MDIKSKNLNGPALANKRYLSKGGVKKNIIKNELANPTPHASTNPNRLNALDSTLVEDTAYKKLDNETLKIEYRIEKLEAQLKSVNTQIQASQTINDKAKLESLNAKKLSIENELKTLYAQYKSTNITGQLSFGVSSILQPKRSIFTTAKEAVVGFVSDKILSKISRRFSEGQGLRKALNKLETLNKNVDDIVSSKVPYGEAEDRYDQLSRYLTKANTIQYHVSLELSKENSRIKRNPFAELTSREKAEAYEQKQKGLNSKKDMANKNALNLNNNMK